MLDVAKPTLEAMNRLEEKYPYAATMLVYLVLERLLKLHLMQYRKALTDKEVEFDKNLGRKGRTLRNAKDLDDRSFIQSFLVHLTLYHLETLFKIPAKRYSKDRNDVFHSNLYLSNQLESDYQSRDAENRTYLNKAKGHLVEASGLCFPQWRIIESNGQLQYGS